MDFFCCTRLHILEQALYAGTMNYLNAISGHDTAKFGYGSRIASDWTSSFQRAAVQDIMSACVIGMESLYVCTADSIARKQTCVARADDCMPTCTVPLRNLNHSTVVFDVRRHNCYLVRPGVA